MKESVNIAYTYARQFVAVKSPDNIFFKGTNVLFFLEFLPSFYITYSTQFPPLPIVFKFQGE